ncbi:NADH-quinone oxidoreductase subunit NuoE family protein [Clostridium luticellarii]|jgi:NADH-quinone oxidoreductase subunit E|uniref:NADP-reducing hydrogenase subunit HndA n=1 Tax=Clostridium luticellarii TaxID=1691940 RepID=A0A2T0BM58_9CLOT|nr:NAD(P)H-dependent oxidoreductase subunit E [Clostridium luticellarii]MCI1945038.1 NAD(P)H-dependent oxidoreductase subunit E [Clostridium luticellarii]MCI1967563.1 NAD(P)H-dependent oxidoreductase subunit E [Clostridium luticellarii]MCI1995739.1 NAD(P)H-dependent oxidoreductase subunit E [Clostridium luticellarii]MCI2040077.1 NAD(P)H-dependent oxidoreductase subunit E [Clostridium luticellarii]PRR84976.1 NADP-reducing hydrogenase subunit HndA [Clostridium luticellarii]
MFNALAENLGENDLSARDVIEKYPKEERYTLAILQDIQRKYKYIPKEALKNLAQYLDTSLSKLYSMATFYKALSLTPKGENIITVCDGTACHVASSASILDTLYKEIGIRQGETTEDFKFSINTVNCVGACALAPVMMINNKYYGNLTPKLVQEIIQEYRGGK